MKSTRRRQLHFSHRGRANHRWRRHRWSSQVAFLRWVSKCDAQFQRAYDEWAAHVEGLMPWRR